MLRTFAFQKKNKNQREVYNMKKSLIALSLGGFGIGITEFSMMGMLEDVAKDLSISIPQAGHLISTYALGVVVGAPLLVLFSAKFEPKKLLIFLMGLFTIFNAISSLSPSYELFLVARFFSGLPHGAFFGVGSIVAAQLANEGKQAQAISIMFSGLTVANLLGVPLGTYIGHHFSWRYTFMMIAAIGILAMTCIHLWIPFIKSNRDQSIFSQLKYFKTTRSWTLIALIAVGTGGLFAWLSYISPLMTQVAGFSKEYTPYIMVLAGMGMFFGNLMGGKLADTVSPSKAAAIIFTSMSICLLIVYYTVANQYLAIVMTFITGIAAFSVGSPIQMMLIQSANGSEMIAAAAGQASFNIGNAMGAFLGGIPIAMGFGMRSPQLVGAAMALTGALLTLLYIQNFIRSKG